MIQTRTDRFVSALVFATPLLLLVIRDWVALTFTLLIITGLVYVIRNRGDIRPDKKDILIMGVFAAAFLSTLITYLLGDFTFIETKNLVRYIAFAGFIPVFLLIKYKGFPEKAFWYGTSAGAIIAGVVAIIEVFILNKPRAGAAHHYIVFGDNALLLGMISLAGLSYFRALGPRWLALPVLAFVLGLTASILSASRGGWIAVPLLLLILFLFNREIGSWKHKLYTLLGATFVLFALFTVPQTGIQERVNNAFEDIRAYKQGTDSSTSVGIRFEMWRATLHIVPQHPIFGVGLRQYQSTMKKLVAETDAYNPSIANYIHPHNEYLFALLERGIVGLLTILSIILIPIYIFATALKHKSVEIFSLALSGLMVTVGYSIFGLTEAMFNRTFTVDFYTLLMALLLGGVYARRTKVDQVT